MGSSGLSNVYFNYFFFFHLIVLFSNVFIL